MLTMRSSVLYILFLFLNIQNGAGHSGVLRIIGGRDAIEENYPYIVRLQHQIFIIGIVNMLGHMHICTGAVLTSTWTLTAAHCLTVKGKIRIGNVIIKPIVIQGPLSNIVITDVIYVIQHPGYKLRTFDIFNDIGLIGTKPLKLKLYARLSAIDFRTIVGQEVTLTGYGKTNSTKDFKEIADDATTLGKPLQILDALVVQCDKETVSLKPGMCLARYCGKTSGQGICPGDSGGPMLHPSGIVGVNSIGPPELQKFCNLKPTPVFYDIAGITPISPYIDWISDIIKNESQDHANSTHVY